MSILLNYHRVPAMVPGERSTKMNVTALVHKELPTYWRKKKKSFFQKAGCNMCNTRGKDPKSVLQILKSKNQLHQSKF